MHCLHIIPAFPWSISVPLACQPFRPQQRLTFRMSRRLSRSIPHTALLAHNQSHPLLGPNYLTKMPSSLSFLEPFVQFRMDLASPMLPTPMAFVIWWKSASIGSSSKLQFLQLDVHFSRTIQTETIMARTKMSCTDLWRPLSSHQLCSIWLWTHCQWKPRQNHSRLEHQDQ